MTMSKRGMKLLAFIMAVAIVLSGLVYSPKAEAAGEVPTVKVLGASLKIGEVNGTQSMRMAIEISKASAANGCAMELTVGGKSVFIRTSTFEGSDSTQIHDNVYSKNVAEDSIVYAVVLKGIPQTYFDQEIGIMGHVQYEASEEGNAVATSDLATRTVYGIVEAMQADYPGLNIGDDGNLYIGDKLLGEENIERTASIDITSVDQKDSEYVSYDDRNNMLINDTREEGSTELYFPLPYPVQPGQWVEVTVSGKSWGTNDFRIWTTPADAKTSGSYVHNNGIYLNPTISEDGSFVGTVSLQAIDRECTNLTFKPQHGFRIQDLIISSISVKYLPIEIPTTGFNDDNTEYTLEFTDDVLGTEQAEASYTINTQDNTVDFTTPLQYSALVFDVPAEVSDNYSVSAVELTYEDADSTFATEVAYTDGIGAEANYGTEAGSQTVTRTVNFAYGHELDIFKIFSMNEAGLNIKIKSVKFMLTGKPLFSGWNEDHTEYTLNLDECLSWQNSNVTKTKNADGTYTYVKNTDGEFGFCVPADIYNNYRFTKAVVKYRDGSWGGTGYTVHYGTDTVSWISGEEAHYSGEFTGTGERSLSINYANEDGTNYSNTRFFNGTVGGSVTIEAIVLSGIYVATPTPVPTATPAPTFRPVISESDADLQVYKTDKVITVDGNGNDEAWADAAELDVANYSNGATDTTGKVKLLWDDSNLYFLLTVKDSAIIADNGNDWENDGIEFFFDEDLSQENAYGSNPDAFQYRFTRYTADGANTVDAFASAGSNASSLYAGRVTEYKIVDDGYVVEVSIPFANPATIQPGVGMGFELSMLDAISGSRRNEVWLLGGGKGNLYQDPSLMGTIQLVEAGVVIATPEPTAAPTPVPTKQPTGFNADKTKYVLDLNADNVKIDDGQTNYTFTFNPDGSLGFHAGGGYIGFSMYTPAEVLNDYAVSHIDIVYEGATAGFNGCDRYVGGSENTHWGQGAAGSGTISRDLDVNQDLEYYKFFPGEAFDMTIKSVTYTLVAKPQATPSPTPEPVQLDAMDFDLANATYTKDDAVTYTYNAETSSADVVIANFTALVLNMPTDKKFKKIEITYTSDRSLSAYLFDGDMTNVLAQDPGSSQHSVGDLASGSHTASFEIDDTYAGATIKGLKLVRIDWGENPPSVNLNIESIKLYYEHEAEIIGNIELDLTDSSLYTLDDGVSASYNTEAGLLDVTLPGNAANTVNTASTGITFTVPVEYSLYTFEYVELSVTSNGKTTRMNLIDKDGNLSSNYVETTSGQTMTVSLDKATAGVSSIQGIKLFRDFSSTAYDQITSIKFYYSAAEELTGNVYTRISSVSDIQDGDKIVMISNNNENKGSEIMLPEVIDATKEDGSSPRRGFNIQSTDVSLGATIIGEYEAAEWTFTKSGDNWIIGTVDGYIALTQGDGQVTATLESTGNVFTIGGSSNEFTFTADNGFVLNRNGSRPVINGYANNPAAFALYRLDSDEVSP